MKLCEICGLRPGQVEHHILPRALGGSEKNSNKQLICRECHSKIHPYLRYPKGKRAGIPFFKNELATYYGKDDHVCKKAKHLAKISKARATNRHNQSFGQSRSDKLPRMRYKAS